MAPGQLRDFENQVHKRLQVGRRNSFLKHGTRRRHLDPKQAQQVAQKATALKGVVGGKASGSQVAKGLDKVAAGETLPPNIIKAIAPYATAIQTMMSNPQLFGKFKALMKQAEAGQNQQ